MTIPINVEKVNLPEGFQVTKRVEKETLHFEFTLPIALPYDNGSLNTYRENVQGPSHWDRGFLYSDLTKLTYEVMQATLPEFTGGNGFYQARFNASDLYGLGIMEEGHLYLTHSIDDQPRGELKLSVHSAGKFIPVLTESGVERPTIDRVTMQGKIYLDTKIPFPTKESYTTYNAEISAAIIASLAHNQPLTLEKNQLVRSGYETISGSEVYIQIDNPTLERMQAALLEERILAKYFAQHLEPITEAARIFGEAQIVDRNYKQEVVSAHSTLVGQVNRAKKEVDSQIPLPANIDALIAQIDLNINAKLQEATGKIAHLSTGFPRGFLTYATAENSKR